MSKPSQDNQQAGQLNESIEQLSVVFVADNQPTEVLQPRNAAFDNPSSLGSSELGPVLCGRLLSILAVWTDQFRSTIRQSLSNPVRVRRFVIQNVIGHAIADTHISKSFECVDLRMVDRQCKRRERDAVPIDHQHQLATFASQLELAPPLVPILQPLALVR